MVYKPLPYHPLHLFQDEKPQVLWPFLLEKKLLPPNHVGVSLYEQSFFILSSSVLSSLKFNDWNYTQYSEYGLLIVLY